MKNLKYVKTFENFGEKTIQFRDHSGSKSDSLTTQRELTRDELQSHLDDLYPENTGFKIVEYGKEYMVKVQMGGQYYPVGFSDSKFEEEYYNESKVNEDFETDDISLGLADWWISCDEQLPEDGQRVIVYAKLPNRDKHIIDICFFGKGISKKEREELKKAYGSTDDEYDDDDDDDDDFAIPHEAGFGRNAINLGKDSDDKIRWKKVKNADEGGHGGFNEKPYHWYGDDMFPDRGKYFGQRVSHWMPLPYSPDYSA